MWNDWIQWLSSLEISQLLWLLLPMLLLDMPRYAIGTSLMCMWHALCQIGDWFLSGRSTPQYDHCPSICVVIAGLNEADTLGHTLRSVWGTYPDLEIIVVDDGSQDGMARVGSQFARLHPGVTVLRSSGSEDLFNPRPGVSMSERMSVRIEDGVADVRLNRPEKMNAIDGAMFKGLIEVTNYGKVTLASVANIDGIWIALPFGLGMLALSFVVLKDRYGQT